METADDVRKFGAVGDGTADDTASIQRAIDACARSAGGVVILHNGRFLAAGLVLRSHVELHLTSTAVLLGAADLSRYPVDEKTPYVILKHSLVSAEGCEHVAITGMGVIDGQGALFSPVEDSLRPVLIRFRDCANARLEGVLLRNYAAFGVHLVHCRQVRVVGVRIDSQVRPNNDGLDIDGCQDLFISDCNIRSGDDSIALKSIEGPDPCRDIVVTNCILGSRCAAIRVGPDAVSAIERVSVSNCIIRDTALNGIKIQEACGSVMRDMVFSNIVMDNVGGPISIRCAGWKKGAGNVRAVFDDSNWEKGELRNILFQNIRARAMPGNTQGNPKLGMSITGTPRTRPRQITFDTIDISFPGGGTAEEAARRNVPDRERDYPECYMFGVLPAYGMYAHHADSITLHNVQFRLESEDLRPAVVCDDVEDIVLAGFQAEGNAKAESLIRLENARRTFINGSNVRGPIGTFVRVEGPRSRDTGLSANSLGLAAKAVEIAAGAPSSAVSEALRGGNLP